MRAYSLIPGTRVPRHSRLSDVRGWGGNGRGSWGGDHFHIGGTTKADTDREKQAGFLEQGRKTISRP